MTSLNYTPLQELPKYSDETTLLPSDTVELLANPRPRTTLTVHDVTNRQITACCLLCSILNYLCCPFLGIPALIFAILGTEADKRGELEAAKSHAFHLRVFNIIYAVKCICCMTMTALCIMIGIIVPVISGLAANRATTNDFNHNYDGYSN